MKFLRTAVALAALFFSSVALAQTSPVTNHAFAIGRGPGVSGYTSLLCASTQLAVGQAAADPICRTISGDWTLSAAGVATLATVNGNVGSFGSAANCIILTVNAKGLITAASQTACVPGAVPLANITGIGTGCATWLATPSSANLRGCVTDETGTGLLYFQGGDAGTPSALVGTNITALNATQLTAGTLPAARMPALTGDCTSTIGTVATSCGVTGTWTPTLIGSTTPGTGQTYSTQAGTYQKIGREVTLHFSIVLTSLGTAAGNALVGGIPFTSSSTTGVFGTCTLLYVVTSLPASSFGVIGVIATSATTMDLYANGSTAISTITTTNIGATGILRGTCTYQSP